jgi:hypothetical protein
MAKLYEQLNKITPAPDLSEILMQNRMQKSASQEKQEASPSTDEPPVEKAPKSESSKTVKSVLEVNEPDDDTIDNEEVAAPDQLKGEKTKEETRGRKKKPATTPEGKLMDWNDLDTFTKKENVPLSHYGMKSQRLSNLNHEFFDELASRTGIPAVHLINQVLSCFRSHFRDEINSKFPAKSL